MHTQDKNYVILLLILEILRLLVGIMDGEVHGSGVVVVSHVVYLKLKDNAYGQYVMVQQLVTSLLMVVVKLV